MSVRICKYGCSAELGLFSTSQNKFLESDNRTLHTKERCQELKSKKSVNEWADNKPKQETNDISLEVVLKKLKSIGITLDLQVFRNAVNGDSK